MVFYLLNSEQSFKVFSTLDSISINSVLKVKAVNELTIVCQIQLE